MPHWYVNTLTNFLVYFKFPNLTQTINIFIYKKLTSKNSLKWASKNHTNNALCDSWTRWYHSPYPQHFDSQPQADKLYKSVIVTVAIVILFIKHSAFVHYRVFLPKVQHLHLLDLGCYCDPACGNFFAYCKVVVPGGWPWWRKPMPQFAKAKINWFFIWLDC